ncbi:Protein tipE [Amphibalanus amphitrite]|uniref:Protein tipE n=1 Tax=Amphibalanus amphitrite TaxID=1232801 RepID=A0A6A4W3A8_AMPAM|nr:Protein tipE [Amphibalanus amphitrite]
MTLLFLVPLVVDPAVATLRADFAPVAAACRTERVERYSTLSNCSWSSCREGCTSELYQCVHVYVTYELAEAAGPHWAVLQVNVKTCGYPPRVNCSAFELRYARPGSTFPCYVSRTNTSLAVTDFRAGEAGRLLLGGLGTPAGAILLGALTVCLLQMRPAVWKRRKVGLVQAIKPTTQRVWSTAASAGSGPVSLTSTHPLSPVPESRGDSGKPLPPPPPPPPPRPPP